MTVVNQSEIYSALLSFQYPLFGVDISEMISVDNVVCTDDGIKVSIGLGVKIHSQESAIRMAIEAYLLESMSQDISVEIKSEVSSSPSLSGAGKLKDVKNIIMVASGKGGVGKSTTAINLALALQQEGAKVGILDADIYGPSMSTMLGISEDVKPSIVDDKFVQPIKKHGLKSMSVAYMSKEKTPMIWRGPMAVKALQQLLELTLWGELDYLIIDMPPGTGDIHISLAQKINVSAAVVVTTPQEMALVDARKGLEMFDKVGIPVLGVVENMATHKCSNCGFEEDIFGFGGAKQLADEYSVGLLGSLPLNALVREHVDAGAPTVVRDPASAITRSYVSLADNVAVAMWHCNAHAVSHPEITIVD